FKIYSEPFNATGVQGYMAFVYIWRFKISSMYRMFPLVCLTLLLLSSCKRPIEKDLDDENDRNASFISNKPGSWWVYGVSDGTVNKRVATGEDSLMQERTFDYYELIDTVTGNSVPE